MRETQPLVVAIGLVVLGCADKGVGPNSADVTIRIASVVSAQPSAATCQPGRRARSTAMTDRSCAVPR